MKDGGGLRAQDTHVNKTGSAVKEHAAHHLRSSELGTGGKYELKAQRQLNLLGPGAIHLHHLRRTRLSRAQQPSLADWALFVTRAGSREWALGPKLRQRVLGIRTACIMRPPLRGCSQYTKRQADPNTMPPVVFCDCHMLCVELIMLSWLCTCSPSWLNSYR